ncbi:hypothetical protein [Streptomyces sp. AM 2-1-1]|uniref:hypothetical protein n=1 Tax=Streptomyces sp. AM 2-1-1 TaxID=3028709 RepID=UPI0023B9AD1E|nr:hypothetical protein [Streptomyces sp. AM 2-1-1]WEH41028.1 hypothetical protein PZB77_16835 [Streptomyces sp. AM 2-1-1]
MDMQEAAQYGDNALDAVFQDIKPAVHWTHGPTSIGSCEVSRRRTVMTVISEARRGSFLGVVDRFWRKSGYEITAINNDETFPAIYARTQESFTLVLRFGGSGQAFFRVDSPCVENSEVVDSKSKPNTPSYEGMENIPRPNIHSDFWSATSGSSPAS